MPNNLVAACRWIAGLPALCDPRLLQIAVLATLLAFSVTTLDLAATPAQAAVTIATCLLTQAMTASGGRRWDWRSPLITGLSLSLLLRTHDPLLWVASGALAIGSKFVLRIHGRQIFNPACFAIVLLLMTGAVWVSPGQWGAVTWSAAALASAASLILSRVGRLDAALAFLGTYGVLLAARCWALGDPLTIPLHQAQSGALVIFAFFMITDPRSTPASSAARVVFASAVACLAHWLQFGWQLRAGLFYALFVASLTTPLLDVLLPSRGFEWPVNSPRFRQRTDPQES